MAKTIHFLEDRVYHNSGDTPASSSAVDETTLKLKAPKGYYDGEDTVTITDVDFNEANIKETATIFGKQGTIPVHTTDKVNTGLLSKSTTLKLKVPEGYYNGSLNVTVTDPNFLNSNIKDGVELFGVNGTAQGGGAGYLATGITESFYEEDDGDLQLGDVPAERWIDHGNGTYTDNYTQLMWTGKVADIWPNTNNRIDPDNNKGVWTESTYYNEGDLVRSSKAVPNWNNGVEYKIGDVVFFEDMFTGTCIQDHTSDYDNSPNSPEGHLYWQQGMGDLEWVVGKSYIVGDVVSIGHYGETYYLCVQNHISTQNNPPIGDMYGPPEDIGAIGIYWVKEPKFYVCKTSHTSVSDPKDDMANWDYFPFYTVNHQGYTEETNAHIGEWIYYARTLNWMGYTNWRVPNVTELLTIIDYTNDQGNGFQPPFSEAKGRILSSTVKEVPGDWGKDYRLYSLHHYGTGEYANENILQLVSNGYAGKVFFCRNA